MTIEQEAELARKIEEQANVAAGKQSIPSLQYKPESDEPDIEKAIQQLGQAIDSRTVWRNYR